MFFSAKNNSEKPKKNDDDADYSSPVSVVEPIIKNKKDKLLSILNSINKYKNFTSLGQNNNSMIDSKKPKKNVDADYSSPVSVAQ